MNVTRTNHIIRQLSSPWAAMTLFVVCAYLTVDVQASCGDYLHVGKTAKTMVADNVAVASQFTMPQAPVRPLPCQGPNCRQQQPAPLLPVPVPVSVSTRLDQSAVQEVDSDQSSLKLVQRFEFADELPVDGFPFRAKRPPRV